MAKKKEDVPVSNSTGNNTISINGNNNKLDSSINNTVDNSVKNKKVDYSIKNYYYGSDKNSQEPKKKETNWLVQGIILAVVGVLIAYSWDYVKNFLEGGHGKQPIIEKPVRNN